MAMRAQIPAIYSWSLILVAFSAGIVFSVFKGDEDEPKAIYKDMVAMSTRAFQEGVIFAHLKYHSTGSRQKQLDVFSLDGQGLDFNTQGYPVGFEHTQESIRRAVTKRDCRQVWQYLQGPFRPTITPESDASFRALTKDGLCIYQSLVIESHQIVYNPRKGNVYLKVDY